MPDGFITGTWLGMSAVRKELVKAAGKADLTSRALVSKIALDVERSAKAQFSGSHRRGEPHVGGDQPNIVTGNLRRSIHHQGPTKLGFMDWKATIGPGALYGRAVELGRPGHSRAYPYFGPGVQQSKSRWDAWGTAAWASLFH